MTTKTEYTVQEFIDAVKRILADKGPTETALDQIGRNMQKLVARDDLHPDVLHADITDATPGARLHVEPDGSLSLGLAKFSSEEPTRVHNHNSWGVACIYKGVDRYIRWQRQDDGSRPGHAEVKPGRILTMGRGDHTFWLDPPGDIHTQWGQEGHVAWELVLMGRNIQGKDRLFFEPDKNEVWEGPATELRSATAGWRG